MAAAACTVPAGVGGPAVSLYAVKAGWTVRKFVRVPEEPARLIVLLLALTGGLTTLGRGLWDL